MVHYVCKVFKKTFLVLEKKIIKKTLPVKFTQENK